jgi:hypothetical protein
MVAGLMFGFASKSNSPQALSAQESGFLTRLAEERLSRSSHSVSKGWAKNSR